MTYSSEVLADTPWGWWRQAEASGSRTTPDNGSNATAFSLSLNAVGGKTPLVGGGASSSGPGSAPIATLASVPASLTGANTTIEVWVKIPAGNVSGAFVKIGGVGTGWAVGVGSSSQIDAVGHVLNLLTENIAYNPTTHTLSTGTHHVVIVRGSGNAVTAYVDGSSVWTGSLSSPVAAASEVGIGGRSASGLWLSSTVDVDDVSIYSSALSAARVTAHYNSGAGDAAAVAADSPVIWLSLGTLPARLADSSGNSRSVDVTGAPTFALSGPGDGSSIGWSTGNYETSVATLTRPATVTLEAWVYLTANPATNTAIVVPAPGSTANGATSGLFVDSDGKPRLLLDVGAGFVDIKSASALSLNTWHHLVGSVGAAAGAKLRVDKTTVASSAVTAVSGTATCFVYVHAWYNGSSLQTNGGSVRIAEPAIYLAQLSDARTDAHFNAGVPAAITGTLDATLPALTTVLAGSSTPADITATLGVDLPALTVTLTAGVAGLLAATLPALDGDLAGTTTVGPVSGTVDLTLPGLNLSVTADTGGRLDAGTDTANLANGRARTGSGYANLDEPVTAQPPTISRGPVRIMAQTLPAPTLTDGVPV